MTAAEYADVARQAAIDRVRAGVRELRLAQQATSLTLFRPVRTLEEELAELADLFNTR